MSGLSPTVGTAGLWVCGGCGTRAEPKTDGWRFTDAAWCPECGWLA